MLVLHRAPTEVVITDMSKVIGVEKNRAGITEVQIWGQTSLLVRESVAVVKAALRQYQAKQLALQRARERQEKEMVGADFESSEAAA